jgi:predicted TIM-barrel fold metal-dependent hydrolase
MPSDAQPAILVDAHAHIFTRDLPTIAAPRHRPSYDFTDADYLRVLDAHGVAFGVIAAPSFLGTYNDYTLAKLRRQPRLRGTAIVDPDIDPYVLRAMDKDGMVGVRFNWYRMEAPDITTPEYRRLLRRIADLDWHVHVFIEGPRLPALLPALTASGAKLVIDHFACPDPAKGENCEGFAAALRAIENGRTWIKVSAPYRLGGTDAKRLCDTLLRQAGPERLLWASDCPFAGHESSIAYGDTVRWLFEWFADPAVRARVGGLNALELYRFRA